MTCGQPTVPTLIPWTTISGAWCRSACTECLSRMWTSCGSGLLRRGLDCSRASLMRPLTNGGNDWERVSMHRVVTMNILSSIASIYFATKHNRFFSEPPNRLSPTFFEESNVLLNLWTTLFFARYYVTFSQVRWANLQSTSVKFLQDAVCQKSLKSVNIWPSYLKNNNVSVFIETQCIYRPTNKQTKQKK